MIRPSPAIVTQNAVRPLPRWALLLLCIAYVLAGFIGRDPWRGDDMQAFGFMRAMAQGQADWTTPLLAGLPPSTDGLLPLWLGAASMQLIGSVLGLELAARLPFIALLAVTLAATWWATHDLARRPLAQPVAFAFGGEAQPRDYARALADASLLALIATLGLAQFSHETTSHLSQLCGTTLVFLAAASMPVRRTRATLTAAIGLLILVFSGAPSMALLLGLGSGALLACSDESVPTQTQRQRNYAIWLALALATAVLSSALGLWRWRIVAPADAKEWGSLLRLLVWFAWPTWLLALWAVWRWRQQIAERQRHLLLPLWFVAVALAATLTTTPADRALLQALPALAALAAFALPTLGRSLAALIDWFTLLFFSLSATVIWVIWLAVQTGIPAKPAANVAKLAPGYVHSFAPWPLALALLATLAWCVLVRWRTARHRPAIWKSLVLPAGGAALGWLLLMTLWLPLLNYGRSYAPQVARVATVIRTAQGSNPPTAADCIQPHGLDPGLVAALSYHGGLRVANAAQAASCHWAVVDIETYNDTPATLAPAAWEELALVQRPTDRRDRLAVLRRRPAP